MDLNLFSSKKGLLAIMLGLSLTAQGVENNVNVKHLANEQNIIVLDSVKRFLLLRQKARLTLLLIISFS